MNKSTLGGLAFIAVSSLSAHAAGEKCYEAVLVPKANGCGSKSGSHSCAGQAKTPFDKDEWASVKSKELCKKIQALVNTPGGKEYLGEQLAAVLRYKADFEKAYKSGAYKK